MAVTSTKSQVGKEDFKIQINTNAPETFYRLCSTGELLSLTKLPDIWDGQGKIVVRQMITKDENGTVIHSFGGIE